MPLFKSNMNIKLKAQYVFVQRYWLTHVWVWHTLARTHTHAAGICKAKPASKGVKIQSAKHRQHDGWHAYMLNATFFPSSISKQNCKNMLFSLRSGKINWVYVSVCGWHGMAWHGYMDWHRASVTHTLCVSVSEWVCLYVNCRIRVTYYSNDDMTLHCSVFGLSFCLSLPRWIRGHVLPHLFYISNHLTFDLSSKCREW